MKIRQPTLKIFIDKVDQLEKVIIPDLKARSIHWLKYQDGTYARDEYWTSVARRELETALDNFREAISELYDFQNEKGLVDVHATEV